MNYLNGGIMNTLDEMHSERTGSRVRILLDKVESVYLRALRVLILIIATLMVLFAVWLCLSGVFNMMRSPDSVVVEPAKVEASELTSAKLPERATTASPTAAADPLAQERKFYTDFGKRYFKIYSVSFEPYRQPDDKQLAQNEFMDAYLKPDDRLQAIAGGDVNFQSDKADLEGLLVTMTEAAKLPQTVERLQKYKRAKRVEVSRKVERSRTETRRGWETYSTSCEGWYQDPIGCPVTRTVQVPYTETVKSMELPEGTQSHAEIFQAFQERYFQLLYERRSANAQAAQQERENIEHANIQGEASLVTAMQVLGGFLVLMFFFLLIAIERHQRSIAVQDRPSPTE